MTKLTVADQNFVKGLKADKIFGYRRKWGYRSKGALHSVRNGKM